MVTDRDSSSSRRDLLNFLEETGHQLQLAEARAKRAIAEIDRWRTDQQVFYLDHLNRQPNQMDWFLNQLDELQAQRTQIKLNLDSAKARLERLIDAGVIRESTLFRPQHQTYTPGRMWAEVSRLQCQLPILSISLCVAQAAWEVAFAPWISGVGEVPSN